MASVLQNPAKRRRIVEKVRSVLDDVTGDADRDLGNNPDARIALKLRSLLDDFTGDRDRDLSGRGLTVVARRRRRGA